MSEANCAAAARPRAEGEARVPSNRAPVPLWAKRALRGLRADLLARPAFRRSPAKQALRGRKLGFALVLTNCPANTRGNSGNNWRVRHTISRPFFFAAEAVSRARLARLAKNRRVEIGSLLRYCRRCAGVESDFRSLRFNDRSGGQVDVARPSRPCRKVAAEPSLPVSLSALACARLGSL